MFPTRRITTLACLAVVAFDAVAALASKAIGFPYGYAMPGTLLIYLAVGFLVACATGSIRSASRAAAIVGAVDATIGWVVSGLILNPDGMLAMREKLAVIVVVTLVMTVLLVIAFAAASGALGGWVAMRSAASAEPAA